MGIYPLYSHSLLLSSGNSAESFNCFDFNCFENVAVRLRGCEASPHHTPQQRKKVRLVSGVGRDCINKHTVCSGAVEDEKRFLSLFLRSSETTKSSC